MDKRLAQLGGIPTPEQSVIHHVPDTPDNLPNSDPEFHLLVHLHPLHRCAVFFVMPRHHRACVCRHFCRGGTPLAQLGKVDGHQDRPELDQRDKQEVRVRVKSSISRYSNHQ